MKLFTDKQLDAMKQHGWTPTQVWELMDSYKKIKRRYKTLVKGTDNGDGPRTDTPRE